MNIHEYQAKAILRQFGAPVLSGVACLSLAEAAAATKGLAGPPWVVKAQIHAGGRGKGHFAGGKAGDAGGVRLCRTPEEVAAAATAMLGRPLITKQTGPQGRLVKRLYIEEGAAIARELYLSLILDRKTAQLTFVASTAGGMNIEDVAAATPERVVAVAVDPATGFQPHHGRRLAQALGLTGDLAAKAAALGAALYRAYLERDATLIEINPLVVTADGRLLCLDAKMAFDDNALFRQAEVAALRDQNEEDEKEIEAARHELSYIALDGTIGCMVNGAGLAMATMDIIKLYGAEPANFLDVGGGASKEKVTAAFKIITSDPKVKGILVNIFGGIMRCDTIAEGVIAAVREVGLTVPLVVRLEGTNVELGKEMLRGSGLSLIAAGDLDEAAQKIVAAVGKR